MTGFIERPEEEAQACCCVQWQAPQSQDQSNPTGSRRNHSQQKPQSSIPFTRRRREVKREAILSRALNAKSPISLFHDAETTEEELRRLGGRGGEGEGAYSE